MKRLPICLTLLVAIVMPAGAQSFGREVVSGNGLTSTQRLIAVADPSGLHSFAKSSRRKSSRMLRSKIREDSSQYQFAPGRNFPYADRPWGDPSPY